MDSLKFLFTLLVILVSGLSLLSNASAQEYSVSGFVTGSETREVLAGTSVFVPSIQKGVIADSTGFYSILLQAGSYKVVYSFLGFRTFERVINVERDITANIELTPESQSLMEVVVSARGANNNVEQTGMSTISVTSENMRSIPAFLGEVDLLRTVQLLPGVQSAGDGNTGFFVRGGNADQNLVLFDGSTVYNASHLFNFFSVFNPDAVEDLKLYKGGIPPSFGGRLASVLDVNMKRGNSEKFEVNGGVGLIASRLSIEGPVQAGRSSFMFSGRRTYADMFLKLSRDEDLNDTRLYFFDLNGKMNYVINDRNRIFISGYHGSDLTAFADLFGFDWGNTTGSIRWNSIFSEKFSGNLSLLYSNYQFNLAGDVGPADFRWESAINNINLKMDYTYLADGFNTVTFGLSSIYHNFEPGTIMAEVEGASMTSIGLTTGYGLEHGIYLNNQQKLWDNRLALDYGIRASLFQATGPGKHYIYDKRDPANWQVSDTVFLERGKFYDSYPGWEPRVGMRLNLDASSSVKVSYNRMVQYIQQARSAQSVAPYDVWYMTSNNIPPQIANQVVLGYFRNLWSDKVETSLELYYKDLKNISDVIDNGDILGNEFIEGQLRIGDGWSYGLEVLFKKDIGRLSGFAGYTWARTIWEIEGINDGKPYNAPYDRRHDLSLSGGYSVTPSLDLALNFIYSSGRAYTLPTGKLSYQGSYAPVYGERNSNRLPDYHRLDFSVNYTPGGGNRRFTSSWNFSLFNVYGRVNPISVSLAESPDNPGVPGSSFFYIPGPIPSVTWNFSF